MSEFCVLVGNVFDRLKDISENSVDCCVTSIPYWNKRDYGHAEQLGREESPEGFVAVFLKVFEAMRPVMKPTGTFWLNVDDSYYEGQLAGIPWRLALGLQQAGWLLRSAIVWNKPNSTPEPVKTRCTHSYEHVFMFTLSDRYSYDADAIRVPHTNLWAIDCIKKFQENPDTPKTNMFSKKIRIAENQHGMTRAQFGSRMNPAGKNRRDVWTINTHKERGLVHLAPYPPELPELCIKAGCPPGGIVFDPFCGSGTTGVVAVQTERAFIGIELVEASAQLACDRIQKAGGVLA